MKTLLKPQAKLITESSLNQSCRQNSPEYHSYKYRNLNAKWKFLLILMSFFTLFLFPDSPEIDAEICNRFNREQVCNIW